MEYIKGKDLFQYICSLEKSTECKASQNILLDKAKVYHLMMRILKFYMIILKKQNMKCQIFYRLMLRIYLKEF